MIFHEIFIALFFPASGLLLPPTTYAGYYPEIPQHINLIQTVHNAYEVMPNSTHTLAGFVDTMVSTNTFYAAQERIFNTTEQVLTIHNGVVTNVSTKFLAKPFWTALGVDVSTDTDYTGIGTNLSSPYDPNEQFAISDSSITLGNFARAKAAATGQAFAVLKGVEWLAHDPYSITGYKFTIK